MSIRAPSRPGTSLPELGPVLDFLRLIWGLDHAMHKTSKRMELDLGITGPQRLALRIIGRFPGLPAGKLAALLHLHPSTLTGILRRLESRGLIRRRTDPDDRRRVLLGLTARGRELDVATPGTIEMAIESALARLSAANVEAGREVLTMLREALEVGVDGDAR